METATSCVICLGQSGRPLSGKRCPADSCKKEYQRRWKAAKSVGEEPHLQTVPVRDGSGSPSTLPALSPKSAAAEPLSSFVLWELISVYGQREHDPDKFTPYELRNGPASDRERELAYLVYAHWKEGNDDVGR